MTDRQLVIGVWLLERVLVWFALLSLLGAFVLAHDDGEAVFVAAWGLSLRGMVAVLCLMFVLAAVVWLALRSTQDQRAWRIALLEALEGGPGSAVDLAIRIGIRFRRRTPNHHRASFHLRALHRAGLVGRREVPTHPAAIRGGLPRFVYFLQGPCPAPGSTSGCGKGGQ